MNTFERISIVACMAAFSAVPAVRAMSSDSSAYAVVLPFVASAPSFGTQTQIFVENHSTGAVGLAAYYVGERQSANPGLLKCSESNTTAAGQTFTLTVPADGVLQFDLHNLLQQKCKGSVPPGALGDRGALTIFALKGDETTRISALARVERIPGIGSLALGSSLPGVPIGALEGSTQIVTGAQNGVLGTAKMRTDCLVSSLFDASGMGNLYRITVKDSAGTPLGSTVIALGPWSAELLVDLFAVVGAGGMTVDGAVVTVEPAANPDHPAMIAACRVIGGTTTYLMAKVYEPRDLLRQRQVTASETPGWGKFLFVPAAQRRLHAVFLRHPDLVECSVNSSQLALTVTAPDGTFVTGGFSSTLEFDTGPRGSVNNGFAGIWEIEVTGNQKSPPSGPVPYTLTCVSGNGMSQLDRVF
jgi:hypothetical protein